MKSTNYFLLIENIDFQLIIDKIGENFKPLNTDSKLFDETVFDTFDWRLHKKDILFKKLLNEFSIVSFLNNELLDVPLKSVKKNYNFWWDFPDSSLKSILKTHLDMRALRPQLSLDNKVDCFRILDEDEKTVVYLNYRAINLKLNDEFQAFEIIELIPVRGYDAEFIKLKSLLKDVVDKSLNFKEIYTLFHNQANNQPGIYSSKFNIILKPSNTTHKATKQILKHLLSIVNQNEKGFKEDIDTEFLHHFRVAIRRTRSALSQIKNVFPTESLNKLKTDLAKLGRLTNRLRDLDVYLLKKEIYKSLVPIHLSQDLNQLFNALKKERNREFKKVLKALETEDFKQIFIDWEQFVNKKTKLSNSEILKSAKIPIVITAKKIIAKKYKFVIKLGKSITNDTPYDKIHALRIECKKLRYLLEFFSSLFDKEKVIISIKYLKKLQDNLGDFNDFYLQQLDLQNYLDRIETKNGSVKLVAAIGALISALHMEQIRVRNEFSGTFNDFASKKNEKLFSELFLSK